MNTLADSFISNIIPVYFLYGLSFFCMGLAIFLEMGHSSELPFARALRPLAGFGFVHGGHEWFEMFLLVFPGLLSNPANGWIAPLRIFLLGSSFLMLIAFGARLIAGPGRRSLILVIMLLVTGIWLAGLAWVVTLQAAGSERLIAIDVYTRYALSIPGAALAAWGLILQRRTFIQMGMPAFGRDVAIAALAFGLYGGIGQLFASPSVIFPSTYLNTEAFIRWFGFPVQAFRAVMATVAAIAIIRSLRAFEVENHRRLEALRAAQMTEQQRLETLRAEMLHRTVKAQESERQRIARELHDETGQTLTALGMGLRGLSEAIPAHPERAIQHAKQLEGLAGKGIEELQRLVSGLHPPQLDDLGLLAALRWYAGEVKTRYGLPVQVESQGFPPKLPMELRTVLFRVAQEAITNTVRHAGATQVAIRLEKTSSQVHLLIQDNGKGFDVTSALDQTTGHPCWGLLGMIERATLVGGQCQIASQPGQGTCVEFWAPLPEQEAND